MAKKTIEIDAFADAVVDILSSYAGVTAESMNKISDDVSKESVKMLKEKSPKDTGDYAKGWTRKKDSSGSVTEYTVYNKTKAWKTHLLEKGHQVKPGPKNPGKLSRVKGIPHISTVEEWAISEMRRRAEAAL